MSYSIPSGTLSKTSAAMPTFPRMLTTSSPGMRPAIPETVMAKASHWKCYMRILNGSVCLSRFSGHCPSPAGPGKQSSSRAPPLSPVGPDPKDKESAGQESSYVAACPAEPLANLEIASGALRYNGPPARPCRWARPLELAFQRSI